MNKARAILKAAGNRKKKAAKKAKVVAWKAPSKPVRQAQGKPIGVVTHFYTKIKVAIVRFKKPVSIGTIVAIRGHKTDFEHKIISMQLDHEAIKKAPKGKQIGIKVGKRVREGDEIFETK